MFEKSIFAIIAAIGTIITSVIGVFFFLRFMLKKYTEYVSLHDYKNELEKNVIPSINKKLEPIPVMKDRVDRIYEKLFDMEFIVSKSPIQLSAKGEKFAKELNSYNLIEKYKSQFMKKIENVEKLNPYTIQEECKKVISDYFREIISDDDLLIIEDIVFKKGVLFDDILPIYSVILRDKILKSKGIDIKNIDKYDPNKKK